MESHIIKQVYDDCIVGVGVEYPGIIVSGKTDQEVITRFKEIIPSYERALKKYNIDESHIKDVLTITA